MKECKFSDVASVDRLASLFSGMDIRDDAYAEALDDVEAALLSDNQIEMPGLLRFTCHTKLLHCMIDCASRQCSAASSARGLTVAASLLRAQPDTRRVECLRDELADECLPLAAARLLSGSAGAPNSPARSALTDLTVAVLGNQAKPAQCFELAHCLLYGRVLVDRPPPAPAPPASAARAAASQRRPEVTSAVLTAMRHRDGVVEEPVPQPEPQVGKPAAVCYSEIVGRSDCVYASDSDGQLVLGRHRLSWPLNAGQRLPAGLGQSLSLALMNPRQAASELLVGDVAAQLMSLINCRGGHLLLGLSPASACIEGIHVRLDERDRLILGLQQLLSSAVPMPDPARLSVHFHPVAGRVLVGNRRNQGPPFVVQVRVRSGRPLRLHSLEGRIFVRDNRGVVRRLDSASEVLAANARQLAARSAAAHEARRLRAEIRRLQAELESYGCEFLEPEGEQGEQSLGK